MSLRPLSSDPLSPHRLALSLPVPPTSEVPLFGPVRVRGVRGLPGRLLRRRRRTTAAGLAIMAAALVAAAFGGGPPRGGPDGRAGGSAPDGARSSARAPAGSSRAAAPVGTTVRAAVRIADAATVRLLRPGDRVDVIATEPSEEDGRARVVARRALVAEVPDSTTARPGGVEAADEVGAADVTVVGGGALVVLAVPGPTALRLAGAGAASRLAVTLW
ncbi:hypothetical protein ACIQPQ_12750 [Streptomyces sp. NPDC091281]|uniref:hypothetical protein n=1 Tax=Streptomyces sp. NPDC091281 TaxID=3365985 RepID=UPI0037F967FF